LSRLDSHSKRESPLTQQRNKRPLYLRVIDDLSEIIDSLEPGHYLPSEPKLAKQLGVSRATLREAMRVFEGRGLIIRRQGVGTLVANPPQVIESGIETLESIESQASRIGLKVEMGEVGIRQRGPTEQEQDRFTLLDGSGVVEISRVIEAEGRPVAFLIDIMPEDLWPLDARQHDFRGSVLDLMIQRKHPAISHAHSEVLAVSAPPLVARQLHVQRGDVLLCLEGWLYTQEGTIIDHTFSYYLPGTFRFHVLRRPAEIQ
jgi:GntR family transcriptional regulator